MVYRFVALLVTVSGCSSESVRYVYADGGFAATPQTGDPNPANPAGDGGRSSDPRAECRQLLTCINQSTPAQGGATVALYGDDSPCWKGSEADAKNCGDACHVARANVPRSKSASACGCESDADCSATFCGGTVCATKEWQKVMAACEAYRARIVAIPSPPPDPLAGTDACDVNLLADCDKLKTLEGLNGSYAWLPSAPSARESDNSLANFYTCAMRELDKAGTNPRWTVAATRTPSPQHICRSPWALTASVTCGGAINQELYWFLSERR